MQSMYESVTRNQSLLEDRNRLWRRSRLLERGVWVLGLCCFGLGCALAYQTIRVEKLKAMNQVKSELISQQTRDIFGFGVEE